MAGGLMVKPAGRVTLTPLGLSQLMAERRGEGKAETVEAGACRDVEGQKARGCGAGAAAGRSGSRWVQ